MLNAIRNLQRFSSDPQSFVAKLHHQTGDLASIYMGPKRFHFVSCPKLAGEILAINVDKYRKSSMIFNKIQAVTGKRGLVQLDGEEWVKLRKLTNNLFHKQALQSYLPILSHYADEVCLALAQARTDNKPIDISELMIRYALNTAIRIITGTDAIDLRDIMASSFIELNRLCGQRLRNVLAMPLSIPTSINRQSKQHKQRIDNCVHKLVLRYSQQRLNHPCLLQLLMDHYPGQQQFICDQVRTFLFAGFETTAASLSFCLHLLASNPDQQLTLQRTLNDLSVDQINQFDHLRQLTFAKNCYQEALRLYPPAWILAREAIRATTLNQQKIQRGDVIIICVKNIQRHAAYWRKAEAYNPQRFVTDKVERFSYIPFGFGARICSGMHLAMLEANYILARVFRQFSLTTEHKHTQTEAMITLHPAKSVELSVSDNKELATCS